MGCCNGVGTPINSFALVSYLPEPLASFLDKLRAELVESCTAKAHVTVLPPRPLSCGADQAWDSLQLHLQDVQPFRVELGGIEIFPVSQVVHLAVKQGMNELKRLHASLNLDSFAFDEPFRYEPHVTVAQDLDPSQVAAIAERAAARWAEFAHPRAFTVDRLTFVQNTLENNWTDLHEYALDSRVAI